MGWFIAAMTAARRGRSGSERGVAPLGSAPKAETVKMCLNWKVLGGLAVAGLAVGIAAPGLLRAALPLLFLAACPLSMLFMMKGMKHGGDARTTELDTAAGPAREVTREDEMAALRAELTGVEARRDAVARRLTALEAAEEGQAVREAETIARLTAGRR